MLNLELIKLAILLLAGLNLAMIVLIAGVKGARELRRRRLKNLYGRIEPDLDGFLISGRLSGEAQEKLRRLPPWDREILAASIIRRVSLLRGAERERLVRLARELGLVDRYLRRLKSRRRWKRAQAAENLGYLGGPDVVEPLTALLSDRDETVRAVAARALARLGTPGAARALVRSLDDPSEVTSLRVAENLEKLGPLATEPLLAVLRTRKRRARVLAARILGNLKATEARGILRRIALRDWDVDLRAQAVLALGKIGNPDDLPEIIEAARDEAWPVRAQAANALGMIGEVSTIPVLQKLMTDPEWWVRVNAGRALSNLGETGEEALAEILEGADPFARHRAAAVLETRGAIRRLVERLSESERARRTVRAMIRAGATGHLRHLADTLPEGRERSLLRGLLEAGRGA
ncbi:HEAT repeat domain-containing protein [Rubrobacter taiwanensis]|jgi:HEAT repeat protein|uniref:HEAT repeat domain-containing protein n=1 Tax=Rubrobacter taiwanensis TaxID=185139 RepID=A0A4R1BH55_9ACTN|nr:HEAT repeat domain-containing protein [Rubrobacter taiwanensis]TCJ16438.1 HEAT repeat domain-containing protein [Rubrobacter taiwanensis]